METASLDKEVPFEFYAKNSSIELKTIVELRNEAIKNSKKLYEDFSSKQKGISDQFHYTYINQASSEFIAFWEKNKDKIYLELKKDSVEKNKKKFDQQTKEFTDFEKKMFDMLGYYSKLEISDDEIYFGDLLYKNFLSAILKFTKFSFKRKIVGETILFIEGLVTETGKHTSNLKGKKFKDKNATQYVTKVHSYNNVVDKFIHTTQDCYKNIADMLPHISDFTNNATQFVSSVSVLSQDLINLPEKIVKELNAALESVKKCDTMISERVNKYRMFIHQINDENHYIKNIKMILNSGKALYTVLKPFESGLTKEEFSELKKQLEKNYENIEVFKKHDEFFASDYVLNKEPFDTRLKNSFTEFAKNFYQKVVKRCTSLKNIYRIENASRKFMKDIETVAFKLAYIKDVATERKVTVKDFELSREFVDSIISDFNDTTKTIMNLKQDYVVIYSSGYQCAEEFKKLLNQNIILNKEISPLVWKLREDEMSKVGTDIKDEFYRHMEDWIHKLEHKLMLTSKNISANEEDEVYLETVSSARIYKEELVAMHKILSEKSPLVMHENNDIKESDPHMQKTLKLYGMFEDIKKIAHELFVKIKVIKSKRTFERVANKLSVRIDCYMKRAEKILSTDTDTLLQALESQIEAIKYHRLNEKFVKLEEILKVFNENANAYEWANMGLDCLKRKMRILEEKISDMDEYLAAFTLYQQCIIKIISTKHYFESLRTLFNHQPLGISAVRCEKYLDILLEIMNDCSRKYLECKNLIKSEKMILQQSKYFPPRDFKDLLNNEYSNLDRMLRANERLLKRALRVHNWNKAAKEHCFTLKEFNKYVVEYRNTYKPIHYVDFMQRISDLNVTLGELDKVSERLVIESKNLEFPYSDNEIIEGTILECHYIKINSDGAEDIVRKLLFLKVEELENDKMLVTDGCELYTFQSRNVRETENSEIRANELLRNFPNTPDINKKIVKFRTLADKMRQLITMDDEIVGEKKLDVDVVSRMKYLKYWIIEKQGFISELRINISDITTLSLDELSKLQYSITEHQHFLDKNKTFLMSLNEKKYQKVHDDLKDLLELLQTVKSELDIKSEIYLLKNEFRHIELRYKDVYINGIGIYNLLKNSMSFRHLQNQYERELFMFNSLKTREKIAVSRSDSLNVPEKEYFDACNSKIQRLKISIEKLFSEIEGLIQDTIFYEKINKQLEFMERKIGSEKSSMQKKEECENLLEVQALILNLENLTEAEHKGLNSELNKFNLEINNHSFVMKNLLKMLNDRIENLFNDYKILLGLKDEKEDYLKKLSLLFKYFNDIESFKYWQETKISFCKDLIDSKTKIDKENIGWMIKGSNLQSTKLESLEKLRDTLNSYFTDRQDEINKCFEEAVILFNELKYILENNFLEERTEYCLEDVFEEIEDLYAWFEAKYNHLKEKPTSNIENIYLLIRNHKILRTEYVAKNEQLLSIAKTAEKVDDAGSMSETFKSYRKLLDISEKLSKRIEIYDIYYDTHSVYFEIVKLLSIMKHRMRDIDEKLNNLELSEEKSELYKAAILIETIFDDLKEIKENISNLSRKTDTLNVEAKMRDELMEKLSENSMTLIRLEAATSEYEKIIETYKMICENTVKTDCHILWLKEKKNLLENLCNNVDIRLLDNMIMNFSNIEKEFKLHAPILIEDIEKFKQLDINSDMINQQKILEDSYSLFKKSKKRLKKKLKKVQHLLVNKRVEMDIYITLKNLYLSLSVEYNWFNQTGDRFGNKNISSQTKEFVENEKKAFPEFLEQLKDHLEVFQRLTECIEQIEIKNNKVEKLLVAVTNKKDRLLSYTDNYLIRCEERIEILKIYSEINALSAWLLDAERSLDIKYKEMDEENIMKAYEKLIQLKKNFDAFDQNEYKNVNENFKNNDFLKEVSSVIEKKESLEKRWHQFSENLNDLLNKVAKQNEGRYNVISLLISFANEASDFGEMYDRVTEALAASFKNLLIDDFIKIQETTNFIIPNPEELEKMIDSLKDLNDMIQLRVGDVENPYTFDTMDSITEMYKALETQIKTYRSEIKSEKKNHERRSELSNKHLNIAERIAANTSSISSELGSISGSVNEKLLAISNLEEKLAHSEKLIEKMLRLQRKLSKIGVYNNPLCIDDPSLLIRENFELTKSVEQKKYCLNLQLSLEKLIPTLTAEKTETLCREFLKLRDEKGGNVKIGDLHEILNSASEELHIDIEKLEEILSFMDISSDTNITHELFVLIVSHFEQNTHENYIQDFKSILADPSQNSISEYELYQGLGHELAEFCIDQMKSAEDADDPFNVAYDITEFCKRFFF